MNGTGGALRKLLAEHGGDPEGRGSCFLCLVDVVPVKNEDGAVIMFILNFEVVMERDLLTSPVKNTNHWVSPAAWLPTARGKSFRLKLPALLASTGSKQSLPQDDPDEDVVVDFSKQSSESVALNEAPSSLDNTCLGHGEPEDRQALMEPARALLQVDSHIEAMKAESDKGRGQGHHASTGAVNHARNHLLNSTSDSDLVRYRAISRIPQITLNFVDFKAEAFLTAPPSEKEIIAPSKMKDRTHHVTEKVTQCALPWPELGPAAALKEPPPAHVSSCRIGIAAKGQGPGGHWNHPHHPASMSQGRKDSSSQQEGKRPRVRHAVRLSSLVAQESLELARPSPRGLCR
uniref:Uncharacterized protein n=1 Tax=Sphaerodactylus townsendi TaxID=933632 RepID=A0ACB8FWI6_9SAUR